MNEIIVNVKFAKGRVYRKGISLKTNDYNSTKIKFEFDREDGTKIFELKDPSNETIFVDEIVNNEIILARFDENETAYPLFTEAGEYVFEISLYKNNSKLTSASSFLIVEPEEVIVDGEIVETYTPMFDNLLSDLASALEEVENVDIDVSKSGTLSTVTITDKSGAEKSVTINDGAKGDKGDTYTITPSDYQAIANVVEEDIQSTLDSKVDKATGKALSTNDFTNTYKSNVDSNTSARHTHSNKTILDDISSTDIANWNNKGTYSKPNDGIPKTDLDSSVQTSLGKADTALQNHQDISEKQDITDNSLTTTNKTVPSAINEVNSIAKGANQALSYASYSSMVTAFNSFASDKYNIGQNVMIVTVEVPDLWISSVEETSSTYTYVDDATIISALETDGYIQVGYYKLSMLETQKVDLTNYVTNTDYASSSKGGVIKIGSSYGTAISSGALNGISKNYSDYSSALNTMFISKGTLENVITGKELVSTTDYAAASVGGVIKTSANAGTSKSSDGKLISVEKTYADYTDAGNYLFVSKGTLENVITGKGLVSNADYGTSSTAGVIKSSNTYGTQVSSSGAMYAQTKTYAQYLASTSTGLFIGRGTLENVITGKELDLKQLSSFDATKTQVLKNINGTLTWVNE